LKVTVTERSAFSKTVHGFVFAGESQFAQLPNVDGLMGVAVSVTVVPVENWALQVVPQLMPAGELDTVPCPFPLLITANVFRAPPCGQPELAGPSTVTGTELLITKFDPSLKVAKTLPRPQPTFGETTPALVT